jgi:hypothetical protein
MQETERTPQQEPMQLVQMLVRGPSPELMLTLAPMHQMLQTPAG